MKGLGGRAGGGVNWKTGILLKGDSSCHREKERKKGTKDGVSEQI